MILCLSGIIKVPIVAVLIKPLMLNHNYLQLVEGITNEMANYLTMALDPNVANLYQGPLL